jgi:hypothetical protein
VWVFRFGTGEDERLESGMFGLNARQSRIFGIKCIRLLKPV